MVFSYFFSYVFNGCLTCFCFYLLRHFLWLVKLVAPLWLGGVPHLPGVADCPALGQIQRGRWGHKLQRGAFDPILMGFFPYNPIHFTTLNMGFFPLSKWGFLTTIDIGVPPNHHPFLNGMADVSMISWYISWLDLRWLDDIHGGFHSHGGTPSHPPFGDGWFFPKKYSIQLYPAIGVTHDYGNPEVESKCTATLIYISPVYTSIW